MFFHKQELQYKATPDKPDAVFARTLQEVIGGQYGEITVAMQYSFQAWNAHMPGACSFPASTACAGGWPGTTAGGRGSCERA